MISRSHDVGFIGEYSGNHFAEFITELLLLALHCYLNEFLCFSRNEQIDIGKTSMPAALSIIGFSVEIVIALFPRMTLHVLRDIRQGVILPQQADKYRGCI